MPVVFARIELLGSPSEEIYERLHAFMNARNWSQHLPGHPDKPMPHAMYQAFYNESPDLGHLAAAFKKEIEGEIWTRALILLIEKNNWAQSAR
jgi:hypothetical protein